jgi:hypothetical protein
MNVKQGSHLISEIRKNMEQLHTETESHEIWDQILQQMAFLQHKLSTYRNIMALYVYN